MEILVLWLLLPQIGKELHDLIRRMSFENPLWGAPHIHGQLLKLGFDVAQSTVSEVHGTQARSPLANMEDLPSQPR